MALFEWVPHVGERLEGFHPSVRFFIQYLIQFVILFFPLWLFVVDKYATTLNDFGFVKIRVWPLVKTVLQCYLIYLFLSFLIGLFLYYTGIHVPGYEQQESYLPLFGYDPLGLAVAFLTVSFLAPFIEELFFRGFVYRIFTKTWSPALGSVLTALLFSLIHFQLQTFIPLFMLGLLLNYAYQKTGSVWTSMAFHSFNNSIAFAIDVYLYYHPEILKGLDVLSLNVSQ